MQETGDIEKLLGVLPARVSSCVLSVGDRPDDPLRREEALAISGRTVGSRRESFRLGRAAARDALDRLGAGRPPIAVGTGREPIWPSGVVGSITHAGSYAAAAVGWTAEFGGIGIDLEVERSFPGLRERVAGADELAWLSALRGEAAEIATIEMFSAKEAIFKAFYPRVGRFFGFESASLEPAASGDHYIGRLEDGLVHEYPHSRSFRVDIAWHNGVLLSALTLEPD